MVRPAAPSPDVVNAPADRPAEAEALPAGCGCAGFDQCARAAEGTASLAGKVTCDSQSGIASSEVVSRGTPGMSQPGSVMAASLRRTIGSSLAHKFDYSANYRHFLAILFTPVGNMSAKVRAGRRLLLQSGSAETSRLER